MYLSKKFRFEESYFKITFERISMKKRLLTKLPLKKFLLIFLQDLKFVNKNIKKSRWFVIRETFESDVRCVVAAEFDSDFNLAANRFSPDFCQICFQE